VLPIVPRSPLAKQMQAVSVLAFIGLMALYQLPSKAQEKKIQQSPQEQSVLRDQAYVHSLLERGNTEAKVESSLRLSSRFASFNPSGDFHAYAVSLIAKERTKVKQLTHTQQAGGSSQPAPAAVPSDSSSTVQSYRHQQREDLSSGKRGSEPSRRPSEHSRQQPGDILECFSSSIWRGGTAPIGSSVIERRFIRSAYFWRRRIECKRHNSFCRFLIWGLFVCRYLDDAVIELRYV
jgi:hypothetical protein